MKKIYLYMGLFAAVLMVISYFGTFSEKFTGKCKDSLSDSQKEIKRGKEIEKNTVKEGRVIYSESPKNDSGSPVKKELKSTPAAETQLKKPEQNSRISGNFAGNGDDRHDLKPVSGGNISGYVLLEGTAFHEGIFVTLKKDGVEYKVKTGEKGDYNFQSFPYGIYKMTVKAEDYLPFSQDGIVLEKNSNLKLPDILLKPDYDAIYPRLIRSKPERGAGTVEVPNTFGISGVEASKTCLYLSFDFSKPMNKTSVEKALIITPFIKKTANWAGSGRLILKCDSLAPADALKPNTEYRVIFLDGAVSLDGKKLVKPESFTFLTGGLRFINSIPASGTKNHTPGGRFLQFNFNFPVDKSSADADNFFIKPEIKARSSKRTSKDNHLDFQAENILPTNTRFEFALKKGIKDLFGGVLEKEETIKFSTEVLRVMTTWPKDGEKSISTSGFPYIFFNSNIKKDMITKVIILTPEIPVEPVWKLDDTGIEYCILKHKTYFNINTEYTVNIAGSITDLYGGKLYKAVKFSFRTESCRVAYMQPAEGSRNIEPGTEIKIVFNSLMNHAETEKFITIEPKKEIVFHWSSPDNYDILNIEAQGGWDPNSAYTFSVSKNATAKSGESLKKDYKGIIYIK